MVIYLIHNTVNDKYYVGKTTKPLQVRWDKHKVEARRGNRAYLYKAMRKYGADKFTIHPLMSTLKTEEQLNEQEQFLIALFKANDPQYGYNLTQGGDGCNGYKHTPHTKEHLRDVMSGRKPSPQTRKAVSEANSRREHSTLTRQRLSDAGKARTQSTETKKRISEARKAWWKKRREVLTQ
jgi:group I intron endonuclease